MTYRSARLSVEHDLVSFDCGQADLTAWLREHALRAEQACVSATSVWTPGDEHRVVAYHSIAPTLVRRDSLPSRTMAAGYSEVPGFLLGRLALDRELHGRGLGSQLLLDALELIVDAGERSGGRVIIVDAVDDESVAFYEHHDFVRIGDSRRLAMKVATARAAIRH